MTSNYLEELVAEWYEYQGYFVRRNLLVGKRAKGGYEGELDVVAFHVEHNHLVHIEPSMDSGSWAAREKRFRRKFDVGRKYIPTLFPGLSLPKSFEQIALFVFASDVAHPTVGGGKVLLVRDFMKTVFEELATKRGLAGQIVPEQMPIIRSFQFVIEYQKDLFPAI